MTSSWRVASLRATFLDLPCLMLTLVGACRSVTFTLTLAVLFPFTVVAVMVAVPALPGVTRPLPSTAATAGLLDFQVTALSAKPVGWSA